MRGGAATRGRGVGGAKDGWRRERLRLRRRGRHRWRWRVRRALEGGGVGRAVRGATIHAQSNRATRPLLVVALASLARHCITTIAGRGDADTHREAAAVERLRGTRGQGDGRDQRRQMAAPTHGRCAGAARSDGYQSSRPCCVSSPRNGCRQVSLYWTKVRCAAYTEQASICSLVATRRCSRARAAAGDAPDVPADAPHTPRAARAPGMLTHAGHRAPLLAHVRVELRRAVPCRWECSAAEVRRGCSEQLRMTAGMPPAAPVSTPRSIIDRIPFAGGGSGGRCGGVWAAAAPAARAGATCDRRCRRHRFLRRIRRRRRRDHSSRRDGRAERVGRVAASRARPGPSPIHPSILPWPRAGRRRRRGVNGCGGGGGDDGGDGSSGGAGPGVPGAPPAAGPGRHVLRLLGPARGRAARCARRAPRSGQRAALRTRCGQARMRRWIDFRINA